MSRLISLGALTGTVFVLAAPGCTAPTSATDLNTAGPPMVEQLLITEEYTDTGGVLRNRFNALAYGHHDDPYFVDDDGKVDTAVSSPSQKLRVVMDELLVGNYLETVACRAAVDDTVPATSQSYSHVPLGTTPDDIAKCSGPLDVIRQTCPGPHAVCINNTAGPVNIPGVGTAEVGDPVGILDSDPAPDGDGVPDTDQFIGSAVQIVCQGVSGAIDVPLDLNNTYWQPSGNQQVPAHGGVGALGPAVVMQPLYGLPVAARCTLEFDPSVVDKDGNIVCAPPDGDVSQPCAADGDTSTIDFGVAALRLVGSFPPDNGTNQPTNAKVYVQTSSLMSIASLESDVTITANGNPVTGFTVTKEASGLKYDFTGLGSGATALDPNTTYVVTVPATVKDYFDQPYGGDPLTYTFTTGA
jgi:Bacterial Ig-like domain